MPCAAVLEFRLFIPTHGSFIGDVTWFRSLICHMLCVRAKWHPAFSPFLACCRGVATQCWRCFTPSPGSTPSFPCCQPACWTSAAPPHHFSSVCWLPACHSCWSFLSRRSVGSRACKMCALYMPLFFLGSIIPHEHFGALLGSNLKASLSTRITG